MALEFSDFIINLNESAPEDLHPRLREVLDSNLPPHQKRNHITKVLRALKDNGEESGIKDKMPKGSSRTVMIHKEEHPITLDGQKTSIPTITKFAHTSPLQRNSLEHHVKEEFDPGESFGTRQNGAETDRWMHQHYATIHRTENGFETNKHGIIPPHIDSAPDNSWAQLGHAKDINDKRFRELTVHPDFPKGISHQEFQDTLNREHSLANGKKHWSNTSGRRMDEVREHPFVDTACELCSNTNTHPADFNIHNMGEWKHPITGTSHPVIRDVGGEEGLLGLYTKARERKYHSDNQNTERKMAVERAKRGLNF